MSSIQTVTASGGSFMIVDANGNAQKVDLGTLMMMVNMDRTGNLDVQIAEMINEIQERNNEIKTLTELLAWCRTSKANGTDDGSPSRGCPVTINGVTKPCQGPGSWAEYFGFEWCDRPKDKSKWDAAWDTNIANIKAEIDLRNNDSQMANIELQNLLEKRGNAFEMTTKVMETNNQSIQSILRNL